MIYRLIITLIISSFCCFRVFAQNPQEAVVNYKYIPPTINYYTYLKVFGFDDDNIKWNASNNLRRKTGSAFFALGDLLVLDGYVTDIDNVPIDNVQVKIVQANANGVYNSLSSKEDALYDANFAGNGVTYTDNRGYYRFITIFPGYYNKRAPHLHALFMHEQHGVLETEIFFSNHPRNKNDYKYKQLTDRQKALLTADVFFINSEDKSQGKNAKFNVTLNTTQGNKRL